MMVGEAVALDAREPREPVERCDRGESHIAGNGYSVGSSRLCLALPFLAPALTLELELELDDPGRVAGSSVSSTEDKDNGLDTNVENGVDRDILDEPNPGSLARGIKEGLRA